MEEPLRVAEFHRGVGRERRQRLQLTRLGPDPKGTRLRKDAPRTGVADNGLQRKRRAVVAHRHEARGRIDGLHADCVLAPVDGQARNDQQIGIRAVVEHSVVADEGRAVVGRLDGLAHAVRPVQAEGIAVVPRLDAGQGAQGTASGPGFGGEEGGVRPVRA